MRRSESGVALIMTVATLAVVMTLTTTAVCVVLANTADARRSNARMVARAAAEAGADEFFSRVIRDPGYFAAPAGGGTPPYLDPATADPAYAPQWTTVPAGAPQTCTNSYDDVCVQVRAVVSRQPGNPYADAVTVEVTAATLCPSGVAHLATCVTDTVHQRLTQRQFFDYLYLDQLETLDPLLYGTAADQATAARRCALLATGRPAGCTAVPFLSGDVVSGPIHTNDTSFSDCGTPRFQPTLDRSGAPTHDPTALEATGAAVFVPAPSPACAGSSPALSTGVAEAPNAPSFSFAVDVSGLAHVAATADSYRGPTTITLDGRSTPGRGRYGAVAGASPPTPADRPWPGSGVIYVDGDAYVSGTACDPVSIAATGDIFVQDDLAYGPAATCPAAATGLEADDSVVVLPTRGPAGPAVNATTDRTVDAAVLALGKHSCVSTAAGGASPPPGVTCSVAAGGQLRGGSFYVQGWDTTPLGGAPPHVLHFYGAIASIWRGAIGGFDPATGRLVSGWAKDFAFDRHLRTSQPPYFLAPVVAGWARSDLAQVGPP